MKPMFLTAMVLAAAMPFTLAEEKTLGEKTAETLDKVGDKTKEAGKALAVGAKKTTEKVKDAITSDKGAHNVDVKLMEHSIEMPKELAAGKTAFMVKNLGKEHHNFEIKGEGIDKKFLIKLAPDDSKVLHVDLKPGSYQAICPVKDHSAEGMKVDLIVK